VDSHLGDHLGRIVDLTDSLSESRGGIGKQSFDALTNFPVAEDRVELFDDEEFRKLKLMMGLRLTEGINLLSIGVDRAFRERASSGKLKFLIESDLISYDDGVLKVGREGLFVIDAIEKVLIDELFN